METSSGGVEVTEADTGAQPTVIPPTTPTRVSPTSGQRDFAAKFFQPVLAELRVSDEHLAGQSLSQLKASLSRIDEALSNYEAYGVYEASMSFKFLVIDTAAASRQDIRPFLLERKRAVLDCIRAKEAENRVQTLAGLIEEHVESEETRKTMKSKLDELEHASQAYSEHMSEVARRQQDLSIEEKRHALTMQFMEKKYQIFQRFLERESAATIIGMVLVILITLALFVSLAISRDALQVLSNGFLVILGYFFGTSSTKREPPEKSGPSSG